MKKVLCSAAFLIMAVSNVCSLDILEDIIRPGESLVGTPYRSGGTTPSGFDCSGFVLYLYNKYSPGLPRISSQMADFGTPVSRSDVLPGDLLFFATGSSSALITHVAIYIGQNSILHAISNGPNRGVSITNLSARYWNKRYFSAVRIFDKVNSFAAEDSRGEKRVVENMTYAKGRYSGAIVNGEPEGQGLLIMNNGDRYEGMFSQGVFEGMGTYYWADGKNQSGEFRDGLLVSAPEKGENYMERKDSPWETWDGVVEGDFQLWLQQEQDDFQNWKQTH